MKNIIKEGIDWETGIFCYSFDSKFGHPYEGDPQKFNSYMSDHGEDGLYFDFELEVTNYNYEAGDSGSGLADDVYPTDVKVVDVIGWFYLKGGKEIKVSKEIEDFAENFKPTPQQLEEVRKAAKEYGLSFIVGRDDGYDDNPWDDYDYRREMYEGSKTPISKGIIAGLVNECVRRIMNEGNGINASDYDAWKTQNPDEYSSPDFIRIPLRIAAKYLELIEDIAERHGIEPEYDSMAKELEIAGDEKLIYDIQEELDNNGIEYQSNI